MLRKHLACDPSFDIPRALKVALTPICASVPYRMSKTPIFREDFPY